MSITLTYTFANAEELRAHLGHTASPAPTVAVKQDPPAKKPDAAPAASSPSGAAPQATARPAPAPETGTASDAGEAGKTYTVDDAKALTMKLVAAKGRDTAVTLLKKYDVPVAAKLPAEKVAAFCAEAEELLK